MNIDKIISHLGISTSIDNRLFYLSKILYSIPFLKSYVNHIKPILFSTIGLAKKALIFDCDNTLWKGILGEDGFENIEMSTNTKHGYIFSEIQSIALSLESQGVLLGLCSKNNFEDVMEVVNSHPDMQLKEHHLSIIKVNWKDKASNLKSISSELNIGLDSIVFIDDSQFEIDLVNEKLPMVTTIQVPSDHIQLSKFIKAKPFFIFYSIFYG